MSKRIESVGAMVVRYEAWKERVKRHLHKLPCRHDARVPHRYFYHQLFDAKATPVEAARAIKEQRR
jgi:hypothetical protein